MARSDYKIPVKIQLEPGRYKHGYVKELPKSDEEAVHIMYANGRISSRAGASIIHEPKGFNPIKQ